MYEFKTSSVFHANYTATEDIIINQGGTDSTKTYSILQVLNLIASTTPPPLIDPIITVLSESVPNAKKGAWRTQQAIMGDDKFMAYVKDVNQGDRIIRFKTGWILEFVGATDEQNAKQGKRQYLFVNEANGIPWLVFWQFAKRTRIRTFLDYNPSAPFWVHEKLIGTLPSSNDLSASVKLIISDHRHNPFLSKKDHQRTEGIKSEDLWKVYARGLTGNLSGLIYPNWRQIEDAEFPWDEDGRFGALDFGYTNDPTAAVLMIKIANKIYCHELCYDNAMTARNLKVLFKSHKFKSETPIYCEHDGDMIRQLRMLNLMAVPARKGPNSIAPGISKVQEYEIYYTASSTNIDFERKRYMWEKNPDTGKSINVPIDANNHLMDAIRYGVYTKYYRGVN